MVQVVDNKLQNNYLLTIHCKTGTDNYFVVNLEKVVDNKKIQCVSQVIEQLQDTYLSKTYTYTV